jgi:hypothetical protein
MKLEDVENLILAIVKQAWQFLNLFRCAMWLYFPPSLLTLSRYRVVPGYELFLANEISPAPLVQAPKKEEDEEKYIHTGPRAERDRTERDAKEQAETVMRHQREWSEREQAEKLRELQSQMKPPLDLPSVFTEQYLYERRNLLASLMNEIGISL